MLRESNGVHRVHCQCTLFCNHMCGYRKQLQNQHDKYNMCAHAEGMCAISMADS